MLEKLDFSFPDWKFIPIVFLIFIFPSVSVTIDSGATTIFVLLLIPSLILGWGGWSKLLQEEKALLAFFILFAFLVSFSFLNSADPRSALSSFEKYLRFVAFVPMYLFVRRFDLELGPWFSLGCLVGCIILGTVAIYEFHIMGVERPDGARNAARFGLMAVILFLLLALLLITVWRKTLFFYCGLVAILLIGYAIVLNQTRAAMLTIIPFIGLILLYFRHAINKKTVFTCCLLAFFSAIILFNTNSLVSDRFMEVMHDAADFFQDPVANYYSSFGLRMHMFHAGFQVFLESPIIGTGLSDYALDVQKIMSQGRTYVQDDWLLTSPHNIYLNLLAEAGILGFLGLILSVCVAPLYCYAMLSKRKHVGSVERSRLYVYSGVTCLMCFLLFGLFHTWININNSVSVFLLLQLVYLSNAFIITQRKVIH